LSELLDIVKRLIAAPGPSGFEDAVVLAIQKELGPLASDTSVDSIGNLILRLPAQASDAPSLMLMAHTDQVGLLVKYVDASGLLRCERNGLIDERTLLGAQVDVWTDAGSLPGIVGVRSRHLVSDEDLRQPIRIDDLWVDVGARSASDAVTLGIEIGTPITLRSPCVHLGEHLLAGPSIDNRAGCGTLVALAAAAAGRKRDTELIFVWSAQEEVGARGAKVAAQSIQPTIAVIVDTVPACDPHTTPQIATSIVGNGPAVRAQDGRAGVGTLYSPAIKRRLLELARTHGIPHQIELSSVWTDAREVHLAGGGVPTGGVYIPRLCSHSPNEIVDVRDVERTLELLTAFVDTGAAEIRAMASRPAFPLGGRAAADAP
jgi:tetrahedral aminopeptidase